MLAGMDPPPSDAHRPEMAPVLEVGRVPPPDQGAEPEGFVVVVGEGDRIHFLDWGGPEDPAGDPGPDILLVHGLAGTAWGWAPVARRLRRVRRVVAMDLRGHGLSDAPTQGYDLSSLAEDVVAVAEGSGLAGPGRLVLAGHGFGAIVASRAAARFGARCAGLVLVDGGWEDLRASTGLEPDEFLRGLEEPPEVLRSMDAFLADRAAFDPRSWDADQERAARASVVELPVGRLAPAIHPHVQAAFVRAMFESEPLVALQAIRSPIVALAAADDEAGMHWRSLDATTAALAASGGPPLRVARFPDDAHNLMRYRPVEVAAAILGAPEG